MSDEYWDTLKSFGVNFGALNIGYNQYNGYNEIIGELTQAYNRDISIFLNIYQLTSANDAIGNGRRWMYQVEDDYDFGIHRPGTNVHQEPLNNEPEPHWSQVNVNNQAANLRRLEVGDQAGYVAENVIDDDLQPDGTNYYVKVKLRKTSNIITHTPVVEIKVFNKTADHYGDPNYPDAGLVWSNTLYSDENLPYNEWTEKYIEPPFNKSATGPYNFIEGATNIILNDSLGLTGVDDYLTITDTYTPYEYKIYWYSVVSCDLDYLIIEDEESFKLNNGEYDDTIVQIVSEFSDKDGLGKIKVADEPETPRFLTVRYMQRKIEELLLPEYSDRGALSFHHPTNGTNYIQWVTPQQYRAQSEINILLSDIYPIRLYYEDTLIPFVVPGDENYNPVLQERLKTHLTNILEDEITTSMRFEKPFWFTPQAHAVEDNYREPSAYEIKAMTNLGICYGAKGIVYFMYTYYEGPPLAYTTFLDKDATGNLIPRYTDDYGYPRWDLIKNLNYKLGDLSNDLINLARQNAIYIADGQPVGSYITNVQSYYEAWEGPLIPDPPAEIYVHLGLFKKTDEPNNDLLDYFFIVNRRTLPNDVRSIYVDIDKSGYGYNNWYVKQIGTDDGFVINQAGDFFINYEPGDGNLFRLAPSVLYGGLLLYDESIGTSALNEDLTIANDATLTVNGIYTVNANITVKDGGIIKTVNDGEIHFAPGKKLIIEGLATVKGTAAQKLTLDFHDRNDNTGIEVLTDGDFTASKK